MHEARRTLNSVLRESTRLGLQKDVFEAQLGLASGQPNRDSRQKELDRVYREAASGGYEIIALEARKGNL